MRQFDYLRFKWHVAALRFEVAALRHWQLLRKAGFRPEQPRDKEGKWTAEGEEEDNGQSGQSSFDEYEAESDDALDHFILAAGGRGHHYVPKAEFG